MYYAVYSEELYHHGIKGQRWGIRRFQNADGSLKAAGRKRYSDMTDEEKSATRHKVVAAVGGVAAGLKAANQHYENAMKNKPGRNKRQTPRDGTKAKFQLSEGQKKAIKIGATAAAAALVAYGAYKTASVVQEAHRGKTLFDRLSPEIRDRTLESMRSKGSARLYLSKDNDIAWHLSTANTFQKDLDAAKKKYDQIMSNPQAFESWEGAEAKNSIDFWEKAINDHFKAVDEELKKYK